LNSATGNSVTVNQLVDAIGSVLGRDTDRRYLPPRPGEIPASWADLTAARDALGWQPKIDLTEGLRRTAESYF
jgi:nucleoside-diphosphate-sugar epimerase